MTRRAVVALLLEVAFLVVAMAVYFSIRGGLPEPVNEAVARSTKIIHVEQAMGIFVERDWQGPVLGNSTLMKVANGIYVWGHFPVIIVVAALLFIRKRERYALYRNAFLLSAFIGLWGYAFFPAAPPRLMPVPYGFVDTIALVARETYDMQPGGFVNHYAAVPSLHFGWALLMGIAIIDVYRKPVAWIPAALVPAAMFWAIVATGNHFIFDMMVGGAIVLVSLATAFVLQSGLQRRPIGLASRRVTATG